MSVNLPIPVQMVCPEYVGDGTSMRNQATVVITPLRITWVSDEAQKVSFGCSFWKYCSNELCSFSKAGSDK